ncbi:hypothetical protein ABIB62_004730 [Mucilaginibacter sp. UYP25]|uniref:pentapeptide repeat-containing protein n=1 Tax=unclassified Mucilaginibacter TaxID=2617802 RepID=UPI003398AC4E
MKALLLIALSSCLQHLRPDALDTGHVRSTSDRVSVFVNKERATIGTQFDLSGKTVYIKNGKPYHEQNKNLSYNRLSFEKISFTKSLFPDTVDFHYCDFLGEAKFVETIFEKPALFHASRFDKLNNFTRAHFRGSLFMNFLNLKDSASFIYYQTELPDFIDFSNNNQIPKLIDLTIANFENTKLYQPVSRRWHYINLYYTEMPKVKIDYQHFRLCFYKNFFMSDPNLKVVRHGKRIRVLVKGRLVDTTELAENSYFREYIGKIIPQSVQPADPNSFWQAISPFSVGQYPVISIFMRECLARDCFPKPLSEEEVSSMYEKVLKNFEGEGQRTSYKTLDIEYKTYRGDWLAHYWNCYGYHKEWVFYWAGIFMFIFTCITVFKLKALNEIYRFSYIDVAVTKLKPKKSCAGQLKGWGYAFVYTASIFFPLSLEFKSLQLKNLWVVYVLLVYVIGVLCLGYMAGFILQK